MGEAATQSAAHADERSKQAEAARKPLVAERLKDLSRLWKRVAEEEKRAAEQEKLAAELEEKTLDLESKARRASSLLEQTEARRARALARLQQLGIEVPLEKSSAKPESTASEAPANPSGGTDKK